MAGTKESIQEPGSRLRSLKRRDDGCASARQDYGHPAAGLPCCARQNSGGSYACSEGIGRGHAAKAAGAALCVILAMAISISLGGCIMRVETSLTPRQPDPAAADPGMGGPEPDLSTELDLSSVPDGLKVPGDRELVCYAYELMEAHDKGLSEAEVSAVGGGDAHPLSELWFDAYYCERYAYYRKALEVYLLSALRLDVYDKMMDDSELCFVPMPEGKKGEFQKQAVLGLEHLYVKAQPHIERLRAEDAAMLNRLYGENGQSGTVTQEALDFVARTFPELIREYDHFKLAPHPKGTRLMMECSGVGWDADSLVIVFLAPYRYDEDGDYMPDEGELIYQREDWLVDELPKMRRQMIEKVDVPVTLVTCELGDYWRIIVDDEVRRGANKYERNPRWPEKKQTGSADGAVPQPAALSRQGE